MQHLIKNDDGTVTIVMAVNIGKPIEKKEGTMSMEVNTKWYNNFQLEKLESAVGRMMAEQEQYLECDEYDDIDEEDVKKDLEQAEQKYQEQLEFLRSDTFKAMMLYETIGITTYPYVVADDDVFIEGEALDVIKKLMEDGKGKDGE